MKEVFNMVKVSVIIPHYNSAKRLIRLLNTLEDSEDIEIIVIDDKSTETLYDLEQQILKRDNTIILNNSSENKGAGVSRNIGLEAATGDWLLFADADDYFLENASFLRLDDVNLGYTFRGIGRWETDIRVGAGVQNVFVLTGYSGGDPEVISENGIDGSTWPRPRTFSLRLNINF